MKHAGWALIALFFSPATLAACEIDVAVGDSLQFSKEKIEVESTCERVTVNLEHTGNLPAEAMGHNWVLSADADAKAIVQAGMKAGLENEYLPANDDRIIAATEIIGGGESTSVSFSIDDLDPSGSYTFFCSFPGHYPAMSGSFEII